MFTGDEVHYFHVTNSALTAIVKALLVAEKYDIARILDFGCGHGRVLRGLRAAFPNAHIVAGETNKSGVDFCTRVFDAEPMFLTNWPPRIDIANGFDLIWAGSVMTHLNEERTRAFIDLLLSKLNEGGIFVCTFHGRYSFHRQKHRGKYVDEAKFKIIEENYYYKGYGFVGDSSDNYGISICKPSWVLGHIERKPEIRIITYTERGWDRHQDLLACMKETLQPTQRGSAATQ
jgi:SAM-dependent methyltransferase